MQGTDDVKLEPTGVLAFGVQRFPCCFNTNREKVHLDHHDEVCTFFVEVVEGWCAWKYLRKCLFCIFIDQHHHHSSMSLLRLLGVNANG